MCTALVRLAAFGVALACLAGCGRPGERPSSAVPPAATTSAVPAAPGDVASAAPGDVASASAPVRVVDLGHALSADDPTLERHAGLTHDGGDDHERDELGATFSTDEHFGTHVDAPAHFWAEGWTVDRIPADRLVRPAVSVNVVSKAAADEDYRVTADDLQAFERANGRIPERAIVFIATGWDARWPDAASYY
jgi:hypothetical protein